ncbi:hypothetical protein [Caulobacter sp. NIBR2454]|uniref:hypothetical protein n=1 Tax=Caulobacter sp. NIBR2454 TaxID=3015996 RepID=UPI0022B5E50F|nr:hypothetical protein [Caulobacter sp. NIBR2454]
MTLDRLKRVETSLVQALEDVRAEIAAEEARLAEVAAPPPAIPEQAKGLKDAKPFFDYVRAHLFGGKMTAAQVEGCNAILKACEGMPPAWVAYCLATAFHETGRTMAPTSVENLNYTSAARLQAVWPSRFPTAASAAPFVKNPQGLANHVYNGRMGNAPGSNDGWTYRGRTYPHITGKANYAKADEKLGLGGSLVSNPDRAFEPDIGAKILVTGMDEGWFTGKSLNAFLPPVAEPPHFAAARKIINPDSNGPVIAGYATGFQRGVMAAGWPA